MSIVSTPSTRTAHGRLGAADLLMILLGVLLIGAAFFAVLYFSYSGSGAQAEQRDGLEPSQPGPQVETVAVGSVQVPREALTANPAIQVGGGEDWRDLPKVFDGEASISGVIELEPDVTLQGDWRLVVEPSKIAIGRKHAVSRTLELPGNQRSFEVRNLPMGGYRVHAEAEGLNCLPQEVLLYKLKGFEDQPGKNHTRITLKLTPSGFMDGSVLDQEGAPVEGLEVTLEHVASRERSVATTNASGLYSYEKVLDGAYKLYFGSPNKPLVPVQEILFKAPTMSREAVQVPRLASARFQIIDEFGRGVPAAQVRGYGPAPIDTVTDAVGISVVRFLPGGRYKVRVDASSSGLERRGKMDFHLEGNEHEKVVQIVCRE